MQQVASLDSVFEKLLLKQEVLNDCRLSDLLGIFLDDAKFDFQAANWIGVRRSGFLFAVVIDPVDSIIVKTIRSLVFQA